MGISPYIHLIKIKIMHKFHQDYLRQYPSGQVTYTEPINNPMWNKFDLANAITSYMGVTMEPDHHNIETDTETGHRIYYFTQVQPGFMARMSHKPWGGYRGL